jgi:hypothetical protein
MGYRRNKISELVTAWELDCVNDASLSGFLVGKRDICFVGMREGTVCDAVLVR